ncbi:hypothetical protein COP2_027281 [Malus domestica]
MPETPRGTMKWAMEKWKHVKREEEDLFGSGDLLGSGDRREEIWRFTWIWRSGDFLLKRTMNPDPPFDRAPSDFRRPALSCP